MGDSQSNGTYWETLNQTEFEKPYFQKLKAFLTSEINQGHIIYPPPQNFFKAFDLCPWDKTKVVLLGQDPYHGPGQAQGLSFSVPKSMPLPPSLKNIYKELEADLGIAAATHGCLEAWAEQGVLLLNSTLSVRAKSPASHSGQGWEIFTDQIINTLSDKQEHLVFWLWGKFAQSKADLIDSQKHLVLKAAHPSPFSAHNGFLGSRPFSQTNQYLERWQIAPINWDLKE